MKREHGVMQTPRREGKSFRSKDSKSFSYDTPAIFFLLFMTSLWLLLYLSLSHSGMLHNLSVEQIQPGKLSCPTTTLCSASHFGGTYDGFLPWLQLEQMTSPTLSISFLPPPLSEAPHFSFFLSLSASIPGLCVPLCSC